MDTYLLVLLLILEVISIPQQNTGRYCSIRALDITPREVINLENEQNIVHNLQGKTATLDLLILVQSHPQALEWRQAVRQTWGQKLIRSQFVAIVFVIPAKNIPLAVMEALLNESATHNDVIIFKDLDQSTPGSIQLLSYLHWSHRLYKFKYLLRTHAHFYIKVEKLTEKLMGVASEALYMGYFVGNKNIDTEKDPSWFLCPTYVPHAHSGAYVLSTAIVERVLKHYLYLNYYANEGASLGLWLSPYSDVDMRHDVDFDSQLTQTRGCSHSFVTQFIARAEDMSVLHTHHIEGTDFCQNTFEKQTGYYYYNWSSLPRDCCKSISQL